MRFDVLTLFPAMFSAYLDESILLRAQASGLIDIHIHNIREWAIDKHRVTDEPPYGGGGGMVLKPEPIFVAIASIQKTNATYSQPPKVIYLSPQGRQLTQQIARDLSLEPWLILLCGRYEGIDERVSDLLVDDEISIGDYVLTGGELPALVLIDSVSRLIPGVVGNDKAVADDSFTTGLLEGPHYTRPEVFQGLTVPDVLRSGHAGEIRRWRREQALRRTWQRRPDLLLSAELDESDRLFLMTLAQETIELHHERTTS
jgi:tRNA (guanine37-N1)-methyltransferase